MSRFVRQNPITRFIYGGVVDYPVPSDLSYLWNFGFYAGLCLVVQVFTGIFLAMHYVPEQALAMQSVEHIMRDVNFGWLLRYVHANGASVFFIAVYVHVFRGLYYQSFVKPRHLLWLTGVMILLLMIITAFLGYVLPWGQMSFWGATVITNLVSAIPIIGNEIVVWLWGGYSIDNATLNRFFSLHYLLPFVLISVMGVHLVFLHEHGSNNPLGTAFKGDQVSFYPYFILKDFFGMIFFLLVFVYLIFFAPNILGHSDNYILANPMVTPSHIVPEWYFLPFYAILRSVPDKLFGVLALLSSILVLALLPFIVDPKIQSNQFRPITRFFFYFIFADCIFLGWLGSQPAEEPYVQAAQIATLFYFFYFLVLLPFLSRYEMRFWDWFCYKATY